MAATEQFSALLDGLSLTGRDPLSVRRRIEAMERLLEGVVSVPGTGRRVGVDSLLGLIPGVGDLLSAALGGYIIWEARNLGMSKWQMARMAGNLGVDTVIGMIPLAGDAFDFLFRSNSRNLKIIRRHLDKHHPHTMTIDAAARVDPVNARVRHRL